MTWTLNNDDPSKGEKFFQTVLPYGIFRQFVFADIYDANTDTGEQRVAGVRHLGKLRSAIEQGNYTPQVFNAAIVDISQADIDKKGNISFPLSKENKLAILDGGTRFRALEKIRSAKEEYEKTVDNLPIPLLVYFQPEKRKRDFMNLNNGTKVNKSHLQSLEIASGQIKEDRKLFFERAKELSLLLNNSESSPLKDKVTYGNTEDTGRLQFSQLATDHSGSLIASLYGTGKLLNLDDSTNEQYIQLFSDLYELIKERTDIISPGKLLSLPPDGAKGNISNWISIVNTTFYYLYLKQQIYESYKLMDNDNHIISCLQVYDDFVAGDISRRRVQTLSQLYAQRLFSEILKEDECPTGSHFGIPIALIALTSHSCFHIEKLPGLKTIRRPRSKKNEIADEENF